MIVGIDLGTTHSLISVWKDQKSFLIPNRFKKTLTPSAVAVDDQGSLLVGEAALSRPYAAVNFKRYMGTNKIFRLGKRALLPEELSALILRSLVRDAEAYLGEKVTEAVISVPAYFNNTQRKATHLAGELAGLKVERLINEPTAAALAYGLHKEEAETKFLVFDLGGGTFDVSIVELFSGIIEVRSSAGDNFLGGEDFSAALEDAMKGKLWKDFEVDAARFDSTQAHAFHESVQTLKHDLSAQSEATFSFENVKIPFSRTDFETLVRPLLDRLQSPLAQALSDARIRPQELDAVILVGGATRMPVIQSEIAKMLGLFPQSTVHPDEAVAIGCGIQAALKMRHADLKDVVVTDVCPFSLGTSVIQDRQSSGCRFLPIIERNTTIPASRVESLVTTRDNQSRMKIDVYQGESYRLEENIKIGEFSVSIPPAPAGTEPVDIRYSYDVNGLLEVEATVESTGLQKKLVIKNQDNLLSEDDLQASLEKLEKFKIHPRDMPENRAVMDKLEHLFEFYRGENRDDIAYIISSFSRALETQDPAKIAEAAGKAEELLDYFQPSDV